jgi:hypothetical protein
MPDELPQPIGGRGGGLDQIQQLFLDVGHAFLSFFVNHLFDNAAVAATHAFLGFALLRSPVIMGKVPTIDFVVQLLKQRWEKIRGEGAPPPSRRGGKGSISTSTTTSTGQIAGSRRVPAGLLPLCHARLPQYPTL